MSTITEIAAVIAALGSLVTIAAAIEQRRARRREWLGSLAELTAEIKSAIDWGSGASLKRDVAQATLRRRLGNAELPATRALAVAALQGGEATSSELAVKAGEELDIALGAQPRH